jgi:hypothetical protein
MAIKIERKIVKYNVQKPEDKAAAEQRLADAKASGTSGEGEVFRDKNGRTAKVIRMHEKLERPEMLVGSTYRSKLRSPTTRCT